MVGPVIILIVLFVVIPVGALVSGGVAAAILGYFLNDEVDRNHEGSELLETNI